MLPPTSALADWRLRTGADGKEEREEEEEEGEKEEEKLVNFIHTMLRRSQLCPFFQ